MLRRYSGFECNEADEKSSQPVDIKIELKPHQLTSIAKMASMEAGKIAYDLPNGSFELDAVSIGILADKAGYGKTMTTLGLIATNQNIEVHKSEIHTSFSLDIGQALCIRKNNDYVAYHNHLFIDTTLIVVKHGIVFEQWSKAIAQNTSMSCSEFGTHRQIGRYARDTIRASVLGKQIVLVSDSMYRRFIHTSNLKHWKRIVVDEADDIYCPSMPDIKAKFSWFITATPARLQHPKNLGYIRNACPQILFGGPVGLRSVNFVTVKNRDSYTLQSFNVPPCTTVNYLCRASYQAMCEFASPHLQELLNANDLQGALRSLNGTEGDDINRLIVAKTGTEIENIKITVEAVERQNMPERDKQARLVVLRGQLRAKEESVENMHKRLKELEDQECPICQDRLQDPVSLSCFHVFCGECLMSYFRSRLTAGNVRNTAFCPICRTAIRQEKIFKLTGPSPSSSSESIRPRRQHLMKNQMILEIVKSNPQGKFIIFCNYDMAFIQLAREFIRERISHSELKGHSDLRTLTRFQQGDIRVIMLNSRNNGSGIDISCATDIIFYMRISDPSEDSQALARAQRVGRNSPLKVHRMYHRSELLPDVTNYVVAEG